jgi:transposase
LTEDRGRPVAFLITSGNCHDLPAARDLLPTVPPPRRLLADRAYDANSLRGWLAEHGVKAVIPPNPTRKHPHRYDAKAYRARNLIERMFCRLKDFRRIATRYDKRADTYLSAILLAAALTWWIN